VLKKKKMLRVVVWDKSIDTTDVQLGVSSIRLGGVESTGRYQMVPGEIEGAGKAALKLG
jgi:hypothetical protein